MKTNPLKLAVMSVVCISAGTFAFADNRTGSGTSTMDPTQPGTPANVANTDSSASTDADKTGSGASGMGQADMQMASALRQIAQQPETAADKLFVLDAAGMDMFEVAFAQLAEQKAQDPQVKALARMIIQDHQQSAQQLMQWGQQQNLSLPTGLPAAKQMKLAVYRAMPTEQFETCYVVENKASHAKAITSYRDHAKTVKDEGLRQYVTASLPKLEAHGQHIMQVASAKNLGDTAWMPGQNNNAGTMTGQPQHNHRTGTGTGTAGAGDK